MLDPNTLAYHRNRPFLKNLDRSKVLLKDTIGQLNSFMDVDEHAARIPEHDAITFYLLNHAFSLLCMKMKPEEPMGDYRAVADAYFQHTSEPTIRAFYYLLLICTRETRHLYDTNVTGGDFWGAYKEKYGEECYKFLKSIEGQSSGAAAQSLRSTPPDVELGHYTESMVYVFYTAKFSSSFGGKAWGKVADCLNEFVWGRYSAETMMDTVWTLCHNNGPIFNKGMLYSGYSATELQTILDVQRSGQIPQLLEDHSNKVPYVSRITPKHLELHATLKQFFPDELGGYLDWYLVEALGSVGSYANHKNKQVTIHGSNSPALQKIKALEKAAQAKAEQEAKAKQEAEQAKLKAQKAEEANWFYITPTQKVAKITREQLKKLKAA